jgi:hypothetical protein
MTGIDQPGYPRPVLAAKEVLGARVVPFYLE